MQEIVGLTCTRLDLQSLPPCGRGLEGAAAVVIRDSQSQAELLLCSAEDGAAWQAANRALIVRGIDPSSNQQSLLALKCSNEQQTQQLMQMLQPPQHPHQQEQQLSKAAVANGIADGPVIADGQAESMQQPGSEGQQQDPQDGNVFDAKTDKASAELYFHYYGMLQHQQNMLQDTTRTGTYHAAITENTADFDGKVVMDVGAGSGILSLFAAQAGAARVYAVEASDMAKFAQQLAERNPVGKVIQVCHTKVEELNLPEAVGQVDVLVSEPMGTLLVNERMLETYIFARDRFMKPGGKMFPQVGRIHAAAFSDGILHSEMASKSGFWQQSNFYGIDMTPLLTPAHEGYFAQVVVDAFDPSVLVSDCATRVFDFATIQAEELYDISISLDLTVAHPCTVHGIATWFDVLFNGTNSQRWLSTAPGLPTTHWFQLRCCLQQPLLVLAPNTKISGTLRLLAHERQSYDVLLDLTAPPVSPGLPTQKSMGKLDMKEPYYRQLTSWATQMQAAVPAVQQQQQQYVLPNLVAPTYHPPLVTGVVAGTPVGQQLQPPQQQWSGNEMV